MGDMSAIWRSCLKALGTRLVNQWKGGRENVVNRGQQTEIL